MFDLFMTLVYIGGFLLALIAAIPLTAVGLWIYERITGKVVLDERDEFDE